MNFPEPTGQYKQQVKRIIESGHYTPEYCQEQKQTRWDSYSEDLPRHKKLYTPLKNGRCVNGHQMTYEIMSAATLNPGVLVRIMMSWFLLFDCCPVCLYIGSRSASYSRFTGRGLDLEDDKVFEGVTKAAYSMLTRPYEEIE